MICEKIFFVGLRDINSKKKLSDEGILGILEDIGSIHGNTVGYGIADKVWVAINKLFENFYFVAVLVLFVC